MGKGIIKVVRDDGYYDIDIVRDMVAINATIAWVEQRLIDIQTEIVAAQTDRDEKSGQHQDNLDAMNTLIAEYKEKVSNPQACLQCSGDVCIKCPKDECVECLPAQPGMWRLGAGPCSYTSQAECEQWEDPDTWKWGTVGICFYDSLAACQAANPNWKYGESGSCEYVSEQACIDANKTETIEKELADMIEISARSFGLLKIADEKLQELRLEQGSLAKNLDNLENVQEFFRVSVWCVDLTDDLDTEEVIGTIEIPGERGTYGRMFIQPGYADNALYDGNRDGILQPTQGSQPATYAFNFAMFPGWQKWMPFYRTGTITALDEVAETCTVIVDDEYSDGVNYWPKPSVNHLTVLSDVPFSYMSCDHAAFEENDKVMVQFQNVSNLRAEDNWSEPIVIGFVDNPVSCPVFLETGWVKLIPGPNSAEIIWVGDILTDYSATPPYLDWMFIPGFQSKVRAYTPWIDSQIYVDDHGRHDESLNNRFVQVGGLTSKFMNCVLASKKNTLYFWSLFEAIPSIGASYIVQRDANNVYWLVVVTTTTATKYPINWDTKGDELYATLIASIGGNPNLTEEEQNIEAYLFACALSIGGAVSLGTFTIEGVPIYYGWNPNDTGREAVVVTTIKVYSGSDLLHLRNRLYHLDLSVDPVVLTVQEDEVGTPGIEDITIYYPKTDTTPGQMTAWFPKGLTEPWTDIDTDLPFYAFFDEFGFIIEVWFKHAADVIVPKTTYNEVVNNEPWVCGGGGVSETLEFSTNGGTTVANGFYLRNSPGQNVDLYEEASSLSIYYELDWDTSLTGASGDVCLDVTKNGLGELESHDCSGGFDQSTPTSHCCGASHVATLFCGTAVRTRKSFGTKTELIGSLLAFNHGSANSITLMKRFYRSLPSASTAEWRWTSKIMEWSNPGCGSGKQGYPWGAWTGALFPDVFASRVCTGDSRYNFTSCISAGTPVITGGSEPGTGPQIHIEHYLITSRDVHIILNDDYTDWEEINWYEDIFTPVIASPSMDLMIWAYVALEGVIGSGDLIDEVPFTDTGIDTGLVAPNLVPRGRQ